MAANTVTLTFAGDATKLNKAFQQVGTGAQRMGDQVGASQKGFKRANLSAAALGTAIGSLAVSVATFGVQWATSTFAALGNIERLNAQTNAALKSMKVGWTDTAAITAYADSIEKATGVEAEMVQEGQNLLLTFANVRNAAGKGNDIFNRATQIATDMSIALGQDMKGSAVQLGKALNDPIKGVTALQRVGVSFTAKQKEQIKALVESGKTMDAQKLILAELEKQFGGSAKAFGETMPGQIAKAKNAFGEMSEGLLTSLLPALTKLAEIGIKVVEFISKNKDIMLPLIGVIAAVTVAQWAWNVALTANPIGVIIVGIAALIAVIVYLATKTQFFQTIWRVAWGGIKKAAVAVWDWLKELPGRIGRVFVKVAEFIGRPFRAAFNAVANAWNNTVGRLRFTVPGWVPGIGGNTIAAPTLPTFKFHAGGRVPGAPGQEVLAMLQAGERVVPNGAAASRGLGPDDLVGAGGSDFDRVMLTYLSKLMRRNNLRLVAANG